MWVAPTSVVVASVQSTPPLVVYTICPDLPTATPLLASLIETPYMLLVPTSVVVAAVQVSAADASGSGAWNARERVIVNKTAKEIRVRFFDCLFDPIRLCSFSVFIESEILS